MNESAWNLAEGDEIAAGLSALRLLGGGRRFEAYLAFSERHWTTCVVKLLRPDRVAEERALASLAREAGMLDRLAHPVVVRGFGAVLGASVRTWCSSISKGRGSRPS